MKKILVIGYGSIGKRHVKNLISHSNYEIIIYTKHKDLKHLNSKRIKILNSFGKCLDEKPDVGFITNETSLHLNIATKLAKAGLDLFIEKPLSNSMQGVKRLMNLINRKKLITMVGCNFRFYVPLKKIKELLDSKIIGKIISVHVETSSHLPDWHPYEDYRFGYAARTDLGGGIVLTEIHEIDYLYWFFGEVKELFSITGKFSDLEVSADDMSATILKFKNNIIAEVHMDFIHRPYFKSCKVRGSMGIIYWNSEENKVKLYNYKKKNWKIILDTKKYNLTVPSKVNQMYVEEIKYFLNCVKKRKKTINDVKQSVRTLQIALAIKKSSKIKRLVKI